MSKRSKATCDDCYFRRAGLCALSPETPCPTFRAETRGALMRPRQPQLVPRSLAEIAGRAAAYSAGGAEASGPLRLCRDAALAQPERGADPRVPAALLGEADRPRRDRVLRDRLRAREPQEGAPPLRALHGEGFPDLADPPGPGDRDPRRRAAEPATPPPQPALAQRGGRCPRRSRPARQS